MSEIFTGEQAKEELRGLSMGELRELARKNGGAEGMGSEELIKVILGECPKCGGTKDNFVVQVLNRVVDRAISAVVGQEPECNTCGKLKVVEVFDPMKHGTKIGVQKI